jgi:hypothetical protein
MPIPMLLSVIAITLAGAATLAFRVVRVPESKAAKRGQAAAATARMDPRQPAMALHASMADEYRHHTMGLREALNLRRARNEAEAQTRLLNERVRHAMAARDLSRLIRPTVGGRLRRWVDQAWLDVYVDRVRREVAEVRMPSQTRPLSGESTLGRLITWAQGGPRAGYAHDLAEYHRAQRTHYRLAVAQAKRLAQEGKQDEAGARLADERDFHLRMARELGRLSGVGGATGPLTLTDPELQVAATPVMP